MAEALRQCASASKKRSKVRVENGHPAQPYNALTRMTASLGQIVQDRII
jgi:hypothetical protein